MNYGTKAAVLKNLFDAIAQAMTARPREIQVKIVELPRKLSMTVIPHIDDYGKLIGSRGVMFQAMDLLFRKIGSAMQMEVTYAVVKPGGIESPERPKFCPASNWDNEPVRKLLERISAALHLSPGQVTANDIDITTTLICSIDMDASRMDAPVLRQLFAALGVIFHAIGKAQGRSEILIDYEAAEGWNT